jgi:hypothetical protein
LWLATPALASTDAPCEFAGIARVVAIGDIHGAYDAFVTLLKTTGLVDAKLGWIGGKAHLVQTGDVPDRGPDSRKVMDLLMRLEEQAQKAGGRVHALLGNHEVMNMLGDLRYTNAEEFAAFRTAGSEAVREAFWVRALDAARRKARAEGTPLDEAAFREEFLRDVPLGFVERRQAFGREGRYGRWLREHDVLVKINNVLFVHGGLTPELAALGCAELNARVKRELSEDLDKTRAAPLETLVAGEAGPLWYRGLAQSTEETLAPLLDRVLAPLSARAVVVGHTVTGTGRIETRADGRVVMIDAGMLSIYGGHLAALELGPEGMVAVYPDRREKLEVLPAAAVAR